MSKFRKQLTNSAQFRLFTLSQLPLAFFAGLKVKELTDAKGVVTVKHKHLTKNPFKSMYFAAQAMAAELSTGVLVMDKVQQAKPDRVSMLVFNMEGSFSKKATGLITFTCSDGEKLDAVFDKILNSDQGKVIDLETVGTDEKGDEVSRFKFTWTLKKKQPK
ncbi:MAG: DUF4442 domain-containing protein [Saprospiraceae bacterium]|nr:DUF4442 domain-containing protein [Saprospiraceae bacterium]